MTNLLHVGDVGFRPVDRPISLDICGHPRLELLRALYEGRELILAEGALPSFRYFDSRKATSVLAVRGETVVACDLRMGQGLRPIVRDDVNWETSGIPGKGERL